MNRLEQLFQRQLNQPRKYNELKQSPFPYLLQCSRLEIFQFIFQIQSENNQLALELAEKFPHKTIQECIQQHRALQGKRRLIQIHRESIEKMDIQIKDKMKQTQKLRERNQELQIISEQLAHSFSIIESDLIEAQKEKCFLEMKLKLQQQRESKAVDLSLILNNLYKEVKQTLNESL